MAPKINLLAPLNQGHKSPAQCVYMCVLERINTRERGAQIASSESDVFRRSFSIRFRLPTELVFNNNRIDLGVNKGEVRQGKRRKWPLGLRGGGGASA